MMPVVVGEDNQKCGCLSLKWIVENGEQEHVAAVSDDRCGSTHSSTASCKEALIVDFPALTTGQALYTFLQ